MKKAILAMPVAIMAGGLLLAVALVPWNSLGTEGDEAGQASWQAPRYGLAGRYPGDVGLAGDSAVVFYEDFEIGALTDLSRRWTSLGSNLADGRLSLVSDSVPGYPGRTSLKMTINKGEFEGKNVYKLLDKGYDRLYARFYCKFAEDAPYVHHFVNMGGKVSTDPWPEGASGKRPTGYDRFSTSMDLRRRGADPPGAWVFYTYWSEMQSWQTAQGESDGRPNAFYGNLFGPPEEKPEQARRGEWQCVEIMIKLNSSPEERDGEQAFWIDGKLVSHWAPGSHLGQWYGDRFREYGTDVYNWSGVVDSIPKPFEGFLWSRSENLKINQFILQYYLASIFQNDVRPADSTILYNSNVGRVEFDDVVLATSYIGPIAADDWSRNDFDGDGKRSVGDVYNMLRIRVADPDDMRTDYDGDGRLTLGDVLRMLLDLRRGN